MWWSLDATRCGRPLRGREVGLSLFRKKSHPDSEAIIEAVRAAGKQGELAVAEIPITVLRRLGLRLVATPGATPDPLVNAIHLEARLGRLLRCRLWLRRASVAEFFNEHLAPAIAAAAKLVN